MHALSHQEVNRALQELGFQPITETALDAFYETTSRGSIHNAIARCNTPNNTGALAYLEKTLKLARKETPQRPAPSQASPPPAARALSQTDKRQDKARRSPRTPSGSDSGDQEETPARDYANQKSVHVYGGKFVLCVETVTTRTEPHIPTLMIQAAAKLEGQKKFGWEKKISLMLTASELPLFAATLLGFNGKFEAKGHGPANTKGMAIERQDQHFFARVTEKDLPAHALPVPPAEVYRILHLALQQLQAQQPNATLTEIMNTLRLTVGSFQKPVAG